MYVKENAQLNRVISFTGKNLFHKFIDSWHERSWYYNGTYSDYFPWIGLYPTVR